MNGTVVEESDKHKHLEMRISKDLKWSHHIDYTYKECMKRTDLLNRLKFKVCRDSLDTMYKSYIRLKLKYGNDLYNNSPQHELN